MKGYSATSVVLLRTLAGLEGKTQHFSLKFSYLRNFRGSASEQTTTTLTQSTAQVLQGLGGRTQFHFHMERSFFPLV